MSISTAAYQPTSQSSDVPFDAPLSEGKPEASYFDPNGPLPDTLTSPDTLGLYDVRIRAQATDAAGNPLAQINAGDRFYLRVYVQDSGPFGSGVFAAYLDVIYNSKLAKATGPIEFAYPNGKSGVLTPGRIYDAGAFSGQMTRGDTSVRLLFAVPMQATRDGTLTFALHAPELEGWHTLLYDLNDLVADSRIDFQSSSLTVLPSPDGVEVSPGDADDPGYTNAPPDYMYGRTKAKPRSAVPTEQTPAAIPVEVPPAVASTENPSIDSGSAPAEQQLIGDDAVAKDAIAIEVIPASSQRGSTFGEVFWTNLDSDDSDFSRRLDDLTSSWVADWQAASSTLKFVDFAMPTAVHSISGNWAMDARATSSQVHVAGSDESIRFVVARQHEIVLADSIQLSFDNQTVQESLGAKSQSDSGSPMHAVTFGAGGYQNQPLNRITAQLESITKQLPKAVKKAELTAVLVDQVMSRL